MSLKPCSFSRLYTLSSTAKATTPTPPPHTQTPVLMYSNGVLTCGAVVYNLMRVKQKNCNNTRPPELQFLGNKTKKYASKSSPTYRGGNAVNMFLIWKSWPLSILSPAPPSLSRSPTYLPKESWFQLIPAKAKVREWEGMSQQQSRTFRFWGWKNMTRSRAHLAKHIQSVVINTINLIDKKTSKLLTFQKQRWG